MSKPETNFEDNASSFRDIDNKLNSFPMKFAKDRLLRI